MVVVTQHAIKRYKQKVGMKNASPAKVASVIRKGMNKAHRVRHMGPYTTVYYASNFKAIVTRNGRNYVVKTILSPEEIEYAYAKQLPDVPVQCEQDM